MQTTLAKKGGMFKGKYFGMKTNIFNVLKVVQKAKEIKGERNSLTLSWHKYIIFMCTKCEIISKTVKTPYATPKNTRQNKHFYFIFHTMG